MTFVMSSCYEQGTNGYEKDRYEAMTFALEVDLEQSTRRYKAFRTAPVYCDECECNAPGLKDSFGTGWCFWHWFVWIDTTWCYGDWEDEYI